MSEINQIREYLQSSLQFFNETSIGVGIVKDGQVVLNEGFGIADRSKNLASNADTIYQIGSCSKAFTSTAVAKLVDMGKLDWDTPVIKYMPWLKFKDEFTTQNCTVRDLLCHRTGLPRHDIGLVPLKYLTRRQAVENFEFDEPAWSFRSHWCYQNTGIIAAGLLVEEVSGMSWEQFVQKELLDPIGMTRSTAYVEAIQKDDNHAVPYEHNGEELQQIPFYKFDCEDMEKGIGSAHTPAGGMASTVNDLLKWVSFHLNNGKVGDVQVVSEKNMKEIHKPQMLMDPMLPLDVPEEDFHSYAMCWFTMSYRGHKMIEHGGNIDGFTANIAFVPDQNLGIVFVDNMGSSLNPDSATRYIVDTYLGVDNGDWAKRFKGMIDMMMAAAPEQMKQLEAAKILNTTPSHSLEEYVGTYYNDAYRALEISLQDGKLHISYGDIQSVLEHYHYDTFLETEGLLAGMKYNFTADNSGKISAVSADFIMTPPLGEVVFKKQ